MHEALISLVEALCRKTQRTGPEAMAYFHGIQFADKLFELNSLYLEKEKKDFLKEGEQDEECTVRGDYY